MSNSKTLPVKSIHGHRWAVPHGTSCPVLGEGRRRCCRQVSVADSPSEEEARQARVQAEQAARTVVWARARLAWATARTPEWFSGDGLARCPSQNELFDLSSTRCFKKVVLK